MTHTATNPVPSTPARPGVFWLAVLVVGAAFFLIEHDPRASVRDEYYGKDPEELQQLASSGSWSHKVGYPLLAVLGGVLLVLPGGRAWRPRWLLAWIVVAFVAFCMASLVWAPDMGRTIRRAGTLVLCAVGAAGVARQLSGADLCRLALILTVFYAVLGVAIEISLGVFRPYSGEHRFAGTLHPNLQGLNCAIGSLAAALLLNGARRRAVLIALLLGGCVLLLMTRSRTSCVALAATLAALVCVRPTKQTVLLGLGLVWSASALALGAVLAGTDLAGRLSGGATLGRTEDMSTLSGRTDLWAELLPYAREHFWLGYGYGGFWTKDRIDTISSSLSWGISSAHSAYLEAFLTIGAVGTALLGLVVVVGVVAGVRAYRAHADVGAGLVVGLLVFGLVMGFSESDLILPSFSAFFTGCGLAQLAFFRGEHRVESRVRNDFRPRFRASTAEKQWS